MVSLHLRFAILDAPRKVELFRRIITLIMNPLYDWVRSKRSNILPQEPFESDTDGRTSYNSDWKIKPFFPSAEKDLKKSLIMNMQFVSFESRCND